MDPRPQSEVAEATQAWADAFTQLQPGRYGPLLALADRDIRFCDPFNDVRGHAAFQAIFDDMYETCLDPRFVVTDVAASNQAGYIRWVFHFRPKALKKGPEWRVDGMSEIHVGADGKITAHLDHWDSGANCWRNCRGSGRWCAG
jgi:hypothetical protein